MKVSGYLTKYFTVEEAACNDTAQTLVLSPELIDHARRLNEFRIWYNRPMKVNSWYRTEAYNKQIGGEPNSQHCKGVATDIALPDDYKKWDNTRREEFLNNCQKKWEELCKRDRVQGGFGKYSTFMHLDSRAGLGRMSTWDER